MCISRRAIAGARPVRMRRRRCSIGAVPQSSGCAEPLRGRRQEFTGGYALVDPLRQRFGSLRRRGRCVCSALARCLGFARHVGGPQSGRSLLMMLQECTRWNASNRPTHCRSQKQFDWSVCTGATDGSCGGCLRWCTGCACRFGQWPALQVVAAAERASSRVDTIEPQKDVTPG